MSTIRVSCVDQVMTMTNTPVIASGGVLEDYVSFTFCSLWDGYYKTAVFWRKESDPYHVVLDDTNSCAIPREVLVDGGAVYFGVFGVNDDGVQRTSEVLRYTIEKGAITEGTRPSDPTPDVYTQLLAAVAALGDNKGKADKVENPVAGNLAALDANGNLTDSGKNAAQLDQVFYAIFGTTTFDAIDAAYQAGKMIAVKYDGSLYPLVRVETTSSGGARYIFATLLSSGWKQLTRDASAWGSSSVKGFRPEDHAWRHKKDGLDPITPEDIGAPSLGEDGKIPGDLLGIPEFAWHTLWPVPCSYPDLTTITTPEEDGATWAEYKIDLPEDIDCSKYFYDFRVTVYGLQRFGNTSLTTTVMKAALVYTSAVSGNEAREDLASFYATESLEDMTGHLNFPRLYRKEVSQLYPVGALCACGEGWSKGSVESFGSGMSYKQGNPLEDRVYKKLSIRFQIGSDPSSTPVETYGVKFEYRKTAKKG